MGRTSDVPLLVSHAAKAMASEGLRPTVASIRERIGKGSNTTILKALKDWEATEGLELKVKAASTGETKFDLNNILSLLVPLLEANRKTQEELADIKEEFIHFRGLHSERLSSALSRLEDAYKILMVAADSSRHEAARWKEKLEQKELDFFNRENIYKQQIASLQAQVGARLHNPPSPSSLTFISVKDLDEESQSSSASQHGISPVQKTYPLRGAGQPGPAYFDNDFEEDPYE